MKKKCQVSIASCHHKATNSFKSNDVKLKNKYIIVTMITKVFIFPELFRAFLSLGVMATVGVRSQDEQFPYQERGCSLTLGLRCFPQTSCIVQGPVLHLHSIEKWTTYPYIMYWHNTAAPSGFIVNVPSGGRPACRREGDDVPPEVAPVVQCL